MIKADAVDRELRRLRNAEIRRLHWEGLSERAIAKLVGCSRSTVWAVLQAARA